MTKNIELSDELYDLLKSEVAYCLMREKREYEILSSNSVVLDKERHENMLENQKKIIEKWEVIYTALHDYP